MALAVEAGVGLIYVDGDTCPDGYTRKSALDGRFLRGASAYAADAGGSESHAHTSPSHSHGIDSHGHDGTHTHSINTATGGNDANCENVADSPNEQTVSEEGHTHTFGTSGGTGSNLGSASGGTSDPGSGTTGSTDHLPPWIDVLMCEKDA